MRVLRYSPSTSMVAVLVVGQRFGDDRYPVAGSSDRAGARTVLRKEQVRVNHRGPDDLSGMYGIAQKLVTEMTPDNRAGFGPSGHSVPIAGGPRA